VKAHKLEMACAECGRSYFKRADRIRDPDFCRIACRKSWDARRRFESRARDCEYCGKNFIPRAAQLRAGGGRFCSVSCSTRAMGHLIHSPESRKKAAATWRRNGNKVPEGPGHPQFMGRKLVSGYVMVWVDDRGYIQEHRLVAEKSLGRMLRADEVVHHRNEIRTDNRPENLAVMTRAEHMNEHRDTLVTARKAVPWRKTG